MKRGKKKRAGIVILAAVIVLVGAGIFFYYQTQYYLVLNGEKEVELNLCQTYEDPGASAKKGGEDVSDQIEVRGTLDLQTREFDTSFSIAKTRHIEITPLAVNFFVKFYDFVSACRCSL